MTNDPGDAGVFRRTETRWSGTIGAAALIVVAILSAYLGSLRAPFVLDDPSAIVDNPSVRSLTALGRVLTPPSDTSVGGRPVANFTLALNYAIGGAKPEGYRLFNIFIHVGAALCLWGIVRRSLASPALRDGRYADAASMIGLVVALVWALHPMQTESVTYVIQRVESLVGFFYLFTLYAFIRSAEPDGRGWWRWLAIGSCWLGMGTKEVMVSAPLFVLFYDRALLAGSFSEAWRRRRVTYLGLFASWALLAALVTVYGGHNNTTGLGAGVSSWHYLLTQCRGIVAYLRQAVWPDALIFDYGRAVVRDPVSVLPQAALLVTLAVSTGWLLARGRPLGLLGLWFFAILAPSSSFVPVVTQTMAEHRMYLPLAAVVVLAVVGAHRWLGRRGLIVWIAVVPLLAGLTVMRNRVYGSELTLWQDTVDKVPNNSRARNNLANAMVEVGRGEDAVAQLTKADEIMKGRDSDVCISMGNALVKLNRPEEAVSWYQKALGIKRDQPKALTGLAVAVLAQGKLGEAKEYANRALALNPHMVAALNALGSIAVKEGNDQEAWTYFSEAALNAPNDASLRLNAGNALLRMGRWDDARRAFDGAAKLEPGNAWVWYGLGNACFGASQWDQAARHFQRAVTLDPRYGEAHANLAGAFIKLQRLDDALAHYRKALEAKPDLLGIRGAYATVLAQKGRFPEAIDQYKLVLGQTPGDFVSRTNLGLAFQLTGKIEEAKAQFEEALRTKPDYALARERLSALPVIPGK